MTNLSNQIKMTDAMERELNNREHDALESWTFNESVEFVHIAAGLAVLFIGSALVATVFH